MPKICPQRIIREAIRLLNELEPPNEQEGLDEIDFTIGGLEDLIRRLDSAQITNL